MEVDRPDMSLAPVLSPQYPTTPEGLCTQTQSVFNILSMMSKKLSMKEICLETPKHGAIPRRLQIRPRVV